MKKKSYDQRRIPSLTASTYCPTHYPQSTPEETKRTLHWHLLRRELTVLQLIAVASSASLWMSTLAREKHTQTLRKLWQRLEAGSLTRDSLIPMWWYRGTAFMDTLSLSKLFQSAHGDPLLKRLSEHVPQKDWSSTLLSLRMLRVYYAVREQKTESMEPFVMCAMYSQETPGFRLPGMPSYSRSGKRQPHWLR